MYKLCYISILLQIILIACSQSSNLDQRISNFHRENLPKFDSIITYLDSDKFFSTLSGEGLSKEDINFYLLDQLGIDSVYFNSGGCNKDIRQKQYNFTFTKMGFKNIVLSKNRCSGFISHKGAEFKNLENGVKTVGLGWDWFYWEK